MRLLGTLTLTPYTKAIEIGKVDRSVSELRKIGGNDVNQTIGKTDKR